MEEVFLCNVFDVGKKGASEADFPIFVGGLVNISYFDGDIEFCSGKGVFSDKLLVNAGAISTTVDQGMSVNDFQCVRRGNELQGNFHCLQGARYYYRCTC